MSGQRSATGARTSLGTLLVAWTFITGGAIVLASAYWYRTQDIRYLIVWLAPPAVIGAVLFLLVGIVSLGSGGRTRPVEVVNQRGTRQSIFRR